MQAGMDMEDGYSGGLRYAVVRVIGLCDIRPA
jgi:hypothetical protein